jgi:hypothetical protein
MLLSASIAAKYRPALEVIQTSAKAEAEAPNSTSAAGAKRIRFDFIKLGLPRKK